MNATFMYFTTSMLTLFDKCVPSVVYTIIRLPEMNLIRTSGLHYQSNNKNIIWYWVKIQHKQKHPPLM